MSDDKVLAVFAIVNMLLVFMAHIRISELRSQLAKHKDAGK